MAKKEESEVLLITFAEQLTHMKDKYGIEETDARNVLSNYKSTIEDIIKINTESLDNCAFEIQTPFVSYGFRSVAAETCIDSATGAEYIKPKRVVANMGMVTAFIDLANRNVDFSAMPSSSEVAASKRAA